MDKNICVFGLGFVGLTLSIVLAERGFKVYGLDSKGSGTPSTFLKTGKELADDRKSEFDRTSRAIFFLSNIDQFRVSCHI